MKTAAVILMLIPVPVFAAALPPDLAKAVKEFQEAEIHNDIATLERLVADDYVLVNSDSSVENKEQSLAPFRSSAFKIEPYVVQQPVEIVWNDGAVVGGLVNLSWTRDGKHETRLIRRAYIWARRKGRWQTTYTQVTRVP